MYLSKDCILKKERKTWRFYTAKSMCLFHKQKTKGVIYDRDEHRVFKNNNIAVWCIQTYGVRTKANANSTLGNKQPIWSRYTTSCTNDYCRWCITTFHIHNIPFFLLQIISKDKNKLPSIKNVLLNILFHPVHTSLLIFCTHTHKIQCWFVL